MQSIKSKEENKKSERQLVKGREADIS